MKYNNHLNYQDRRHFLFKVRVIIFCALVLALLTAAYMYFSVAIQRDANTTDITTSQQNSSYFAPSVKIFKSPYFQFQTNNTWAEITNESNSNKYVYRSLRANLIEHELIIYVNQLPQALSANRVLPANPKTGGELLPIAASEHCVKAAGGTSSRDEEVLLERVKFLCDSDSTNYTVLVGLIDAKSSMVLKRPNGETATYSIYYSNLKATPDDAQLRQIVDSFQTR